MGTFADGYSLRTALANLNGVANAIDGTISVHWGGTTAGTSTAYTLTPNPAWTSTTRDSIRFILVIPHTTNAGASTLNISGIGTGNIQRNGTALASGAFIAGVPYILVWTGSVYSMLGTTTLSNYQIVNRPNAIAATTEGNISYQIDGTTHALIGAPASETLAFYTGVGTQTEKARIAAADFLIGTSTVRSRLTVKQSNNNADGGITTERSDSANRWGIVTGGDNNFYVCYNGAAVGNFNSGTGAYTATSDERLKKNIEPLEQGLDVVLQLQPKKYHMLTEGDDAPKHLGFIAQDTDPVAPSSVSQFHNGFYGMDRTELIAPLVRAIQELHARIAALEAQLAGTP